MKYCLNIRGHVQCKIKLIEYFILFPPFGVWPLLSRIFIYLFLVQQTFIEYIWTLEIQFEQ